MKSQNNLNDQELSAILNLLKSQEEKVTAQLEVVKKDLTGKASLVKELKKDILSYEEGVLASLKGSAKRELEIAEEELIKTTKEFELCEEKYLQVHLSARILEGDYASLGKYLTKMPHRHTLGMEILSAIEQERKRIARDIHDGPAQGLANIILRLELCERLFKSDVEKGVSELQELKTLLRRGLEDVRRFIFDLRPMTLDDLGLISTLKRFLKNIEDRFEIKNEFVMMGEDKRLKPIVEINLFRIIQEGLNNIIKHSQAKNIKVVVDIEENFVIAHISDDGVGFNVREMLEISKHKEKLGLISMQERAELLGGKVEINSTDGGGTKILVKLPIEKENSL